MKRRTFGFLVWALVLLVAASASASPKKKRGAKARKGAPTSEAISGAMGELRWGMSRSELLNFLAANLKEEYRPRMQKTRDPLAKDQLRRDFQAEIKRLKDSYVEFDGRSTGWDVSFLRGEFTHNNDESMLVVRDKNSQNFYFMIDGRLWKWYKAFDAAVFPASSFNQFSASVQRKFGDGKEVQGELAPGVGDRHWIEWQDKATRLRAVDQTEFYGFYSLVFEEKDTVAQLAQLRRNKSDHGPKRHSLVEAVTSDDSAVASDARSNVVDRITGKMRVREQAPEREEAPSRGAKRGSSSPSRDSGRSSSSSTTRSVSVDNDPLEGIL